LICEIICATFKSHLKVVIPDKPAQSYSKNLKGYLSGLGIHLSLEDFVLIGRGAVAHNDFTDILFYVFC